MWLIMILFELFYLGFGLAIASFAPSELAAAMLVPVFFMFIVAFCGVIVPFAAIPTFWRRWMYHADPFRYFVEAMLVPLIHDVPVQCSNDEFTEFAPPQGQTCGSYLTSFIKQQGGYLLQNDTSGAPCRYCQFATGDEYGKSLNVSWDNRWKDFGAIWGFVMLNFFLVFVISWIYFGGLKRVITRKK